MEAQEVTGKALEVKEAGSTRFCTGAAWREVHDHRDFEKVPELVKGESNRIGVLPTLATLPEHPQSVPGNALVPVEGTHLEDHEKVSVWETVRMIATASPCPRPWRGCQPGACE